MNKIVSTIHGYFDRRIYVFVSAFVLLFAFDALAISQSWYYFHAWVDIPVHFVGGFFLSLLYYYLVFSNKRSSLFLNVEKNKENVFTTCVFWVLATAGVWEVVEFVLGRAVLSPKYIPDTFLDVTVTVGGALLGYVIIKHLRLRK